MLETGYIELNAKNFAKQIVEDGYFWEQCPSCFTSKKFAQKSAALMETLKETSLETTAPISISIQKADLTRRELSLPNPQSFLFLVKFMQENWEDIKKYTYSENSQSSIVYIHKYFRFMNSEKINSENLRERYRAKSDFTKSFDERIELALGYKYRLQLDISNCYSSIYTHSIAWAICGKKEAEKESVKEDKNQSKEYKWADKLDRLTRSQKNNETNGIIIGPFPSRIFSEIILAAIDKKLRKKAYVFKRYVDDYSFYFRSEGEAKGAIADIEAILSEYNLHLNHAKTKITRYPFEIKSNMKRLYEDASKINIDSKALSQGQSPTNVLGVLNEAAKLYLDGQRGAYKYALKFISKKAPLKPDEDLILASLLNIILIEPRCGEYIIKYLKRYYSNYPKMSKINKFINKELKMSLVENMQEETLIFLNMVRELNLEIEPSTIYEILKSTNDFALIIALDMWKNRDFKIAKTNSEKDMEEKINKAIENIYNELGQELDYLGKRWLLCYEARYHDLMPNSQSLAPDPKSKVFHFFNELYKNKVTFYKPI